MQSAAQRHKLGKERAELRKGLKINLPTKDRQRNQATSTQSRGLSANDRQNFAEKLQKVQNDIQLRNRLQEQRERELA